MHGTRLSNSTMVSGLNAGDELVFAHVYNTFHQAVYHNICKLVKNQTHAEDLLQEAFILLWNKRNSISLKQDIGGWLFTTSYYLSLKHTRKLLQYRIEEVNADALDMADVAPTSGTESNYLEKINIMNDAIAMLSPQKKTAFTLCKIEGKSYEEAARELGVSADTVKGYIKASLKAVKTHVSDRNPEIATAIGAYTLAVFFLS